MAQEVDILKSVQEKVRDDLRTKFGEYFPEDHWNNLIEIEYKKFIKTELEPLIKKILTAKFQKEIIRYLQTMEYWPHYGQQVPEATNKFLRENADAIVSAALSGMFSMFIERLRQEAQNNASFMSMKF